MKKLFRTTFVVLLLSILVGSLVKAQELPEKVQKAFNQKFPQAQQVKWEKENGDHEEGNY